MFIRAKASIAVSLILLSAIAGRSQVLIGVNAQTNYTDSFYPSGTTIWPVWNRFNIWDLSFVTTAELSMPSREFMEEAVLMTATGGRPSSSGIDNEMYDASGNYKFIQKLKPALDLLMSRNIKPILVIGNTPVALSNMPTVVRQFGADVGKPTNGDGYDGPHGYVDYITSLFQFLKTNYEFASIPLSQWEFRLMTEPDNADWWDPAGKWDPVLKYAICDFDNYNEYVLLYDKTYNAIKSVLGSSAHLNHGNFLIPYANQGSYTAWGIGMAAHSNGIGAHVNSFSNSLYSQLVPGGYQLDGDPRHLENIIQGPNGLRTSTSSYFPAAKINIDESGLIMDENGRSGQNAQSDATNVGAAWLAAMLKKLYDVNVNRYVLWDNFITEWDYVKTPCYNALSAFTRLRGFQRLAVTNTAGSGFPYVDAISGQSNSKTSTIIFDYDPNRNNVTAQNITFTISGLKPKTTYLQKKYLIDANHSNFFPYFYSDIGGLANLRGKMTRTVGTISGNSISEYSANAIGYCDAATQAIWWNDIYNVGKYKGNADLQNIETKVVAADENGKVINSISLLPNSVFLQEVSPISLVPIHALLLN